MCDIVLEKLLLGSSWEVMWTPFCMSSSQMQLFPQCQIPWILAAEWVQNLTWSETCAYENLLSLNRWCILGALMCKWHWDSCLASTLVLISMHMHRSQKGWDSIPPSPQTPFWLFPCSTWGGDAWGWHRVSQQPAYNSCPDLTLQPAELVKHHDFSSRASPWELWGPWGW